VTWVRRETLSREEPLDSYHGPGATALAMVGAGDYVRIRDKHYDVWVLVQSRCGDAIHGYRVDEDIGARRDMPMHFREEHILYIEFVRGVLQ
jgi:hypothetical protein